MGILLAPNFAFMKPKLQAAILTIGIAIAATAAALTGIFYRSGSGSFVYNSIRGKDVEIYGKGLYRHMSTEVAIQGVAQDYVTLFVAVPLLLFSLYKAGSGHLKWKFLLAGTTGYFLVTYVFYLAMAMYNALFLVYAFIAGSSFYLFLQLINSFEVAKLPTYFNIAKPVKSGGGFLMFNALCIALLWLGVVVPPLLNGGIIPVEVAHYTTLIVQGFDLSILLPASFLSGLWLFQKKPLGYLWAPVYYVFLSLLMTALTAKIIAMAWNGYNVVPAIFIIPAFNLLAILFAVLLIKNLQNHATQNKQMA